MEFSPSRLIIATVLACLVMGGAAVQQMRRGRPVDEAKYFLLKLALVIWPVSGLFIGTFISHGVDVAWYFFGLAVTLVSCVVASVIVFAWPVFSGNKRGSPQQHDI